MTCAVSTREVSVYLPVTGKNFDMRRKSESEGWSE